MLHIYNSLTADKEPSWVADHLFNTDGQEFLLRIWDKLYDDEVNKINDECVETRLLVAIDNADGLITLKDVDGEYLFRRNVLSTILSFFSRRNVVAVAAGRSFLLPFCRERSYSRVFTEFPYANDPLALLEKFVKLGDDRDKIDKEKLADLAGRYGNTVGIVKRLMDGTHGSVAEAVDAARQDAYDRAHDVLKMAVTKNKLDEHLITFMKSITMERSRKLNMYFDQRYKCLEYLAKATRFCGFRCVSMVVDEPIVKKAIMECKYDQTVVDDENSTKFGPSVHTKHQRPERVLLSLFS